MQSLDSRIIINFMYPALWFNQCKKSFKMLDKVKVVYYEYSFYLVDKSLFKYINNPLKKYCKIVKSN